MRKVKRLICITLCVIMVIALLAGCGNSKSSETAKSSQSEATVPASNDFTKSVLELSFMSTNIQSATVIPDDVVGPEVVKMTGLKWKSIDGLNGMDYNQKVNLMLSSGDLPDVMQVSVPDAVKFQNAGLTWPIKLSDIEKYAPEIRKRLDPPALASMLADDNTLPGLPSAMSMSEYDKQLNPDFPAATWDWLDAKMNYFTLLVRDDILKAVFPQAKTYNELYDIYKANQKVTYADAGIPGLETSDDLLSFFKKVKALGLKQDGKPVIPFCLEPTFLREAGYWGIGALEGFYSGDWFAAQWNPNDNEYQLYYEKPEYKAAFKKWNNAARDGLFDVNSIIMKPEQLAEKLKKGEYAAVMPQTSLSANTSIKDLNTACDTNKRAYHYRPIYLPLKITHNFPGFWNSAAGPSTYFLINKNTVKESDLPKILNFQNFQFTKEGGELLTWGPESAGLWTVDANGKRKFNTKELENSAVNAIDNKSEKNCTFYGICNSATFNADYRYLPFYNTTLSQYMPRVQAWPLPKKLDTDEFNDALLGTHMLDSKDNIWKLDALWAPINKLTNSNKDFSDLYNKFVASWSTVGSTIFPKLIFAKDDTDFEKQYQVGLNMYNKDGEFPKVKEQIEKTVKDYFSKHTDVKPVEWPVK